MIKSLSIINSKKDITFIARYTFSGIIIVTIIQNNCGCGLFGENPYFLLTQKIILLGLLFMVWRGKQYYFR